MNSLVQATAGLAGGVFATVCLMPLSVTQTRIQVAKSGETNMLKGMLKILKEEGFMVLYAGVGAKSAEVGMKNFAYFYIYDKLNQAAKARNVRLTTMVNLFLGYLAGVG